MPAKHSLPASLSNGFGRTTNLWFELLTSRRHVMLRQSVVINQRRPIASVRESFREPLIRAMVPT